MTSVSIDRVHNDEGEIYRTTMETDIQVPKGITGRVKCPCQEFTDLSKIAVLLESKERVDNLLQWLDGETDDVALKENCILSCGKRPRCRYRFGTSFAILNAIRDACRPYLATTAHNNNAEVSVRKVTPSDPIAYEDAFPALGNSSKKETTVATTFSTKPHPAASNILIPRKKPKGKDTVPAVVDKVAGNKKNNAAKRRIRPQPAGPLVVTNSVWGQQSTSPTSFGNIVNLPSQNPLTPVKKTPMKMTDTQSVFSKQNDLKTSRQELFSEEKSEKALNLEGRTTTSSSLDKNIEVISEVQSTETVTEVPKENVKNLAKIYASLIRNMLIPSTPLELHLLIRLLAIDVMAACNNNRLEESDPAPIFFKSIFSSPQQCKFFAQLTLSKLKHVIQNLGVPLIKSLIQCPPFTSSCSDLVEDFKLILEDRIRRGQITLQSPEDITGTHAMLSLPFEEERDSRHNYRTQSEMTIYRNREHSRDAFLYQLRSFMNVKGKSFQGQEMEKAQQRLREESRNITNGILIVNMPWFAQFLCELLLQVGLAPVEETDEDLLNIADKDKLQRLHKRFSSRSSHANKSSRKLTLSHKADAASLSPLAEAQVDFPGYQEFFFIFLHSADNYNLGIHLRSRMVATIKDLSQNYSTNNLERRLMDLQLFARFLGFLVFSPNWHDTTIDFEKLNHDPKVVAISNGLEQLESFGLSLMAMVEESWQNGYSLLVIPWVTEILKMAKWDLLSLTSRKFRQLLSNLRSIQSKLSNCSMEVERFGPSMQLISFYLESFFNKTIGLPKLTSLPKSTLPSPTHLEADALDMLVIAFSMATMFASSPYIEDISNLINGFRRSPVGKSPMKSRKLRPSIVSRGISVETDLFRESPQKGFFGQSHWRSSRSLSWTDYSEGNNTHDTQRKLADAFFHQHRDLKEICEFTTSQVIKKTTSEGLHECIKEAFEAKKFEIDSSEQVFEDVQAKAIELSNKTLYTNLENSLRTTLGVLGPSNLHSKVLEVAVSLSVARGMHSGQALLHALIVNESKSFLEALERKEKKTMPVKTLSFAKENHTLDETIASLEGLENYMDATKSSQWTLQEMRRHIDAAVEKLSAFAMSLRTTPPESELRTLFDILFQLDSHSISFVKWIISLDGNDSPLILSKFLLLATQLSNFTSYGLRQLSKCIDKELMCHLIKSWPKSSSDTKEIASLCEKMIDSKLLNVSLLRTCVEDTEGVDSRAGKILSLVEANLL